MEAEHLSYTMGAEHHAAEQQLADEAADRAWVVQFTADHGVLDDQFAAARHIVDTLHNKGRRQELENPSPKSTTRPAEEFRQAMEVEHLSDTMGAPTKRST